MCGTKYEECLKLVWEEATKAGNNNAIRNGLRRVINLKDTMMNTALYYATQL